MYFEEWWCRQQYTDDADDKQFALSAWNSARKQALDDAIKACDGEYTGSDCIYAIQELKVKS